MKSNPSLILAVAVCVFCAADVQEAAEPSLRSVVAADQLTLINLTGAIDEEGDSDEARLSSLANSLAEQRSRIEKQIEEFTANVSLEHIALLSEIAKPIRTGIDDLEEDQKTPKMIRNAVRKRIAASVEERFQDDKAKLDKWTSALQDILDELKQQDISREDLLSFYTQVADSLEAASKSKEYAPEPDVETGDEEQSLFSLTEQKLRVRQKIDEFTADASANRGLLSDLARHFRLGEDELGKNSKTVRQIRRAVRVRIADSMAEEFKDNKAKLEKWNSALEDLIVGLKKQDIPRKELLTFYTQVADTLEAAAKLREDETQAVGGIGQAQLAELNAWDAISTKLRSDIQKFSKADAKTYKKHVEEYSEVIKKILERTYDDDEVLAIKDDTRKATLNFIAEKITGKKSRELWAEAYTSFAEWVEKSERLDGDTVKGWQNALILLTESLGGSVGAYAGWLQQARQRVNSPGRTSSAASTGASGGSNQRAHHSWYRHHLHWHRRN